MYHAIICVVAIHSVAEDANSIARFAFYTEGFLQLMTDYQSVHITAKKRKYLDGVASKDSVMKTML